MGRNSVPELEEEVFAGKGVFQQDRAPHPSVPSSGALPTMSVELKLVEQQLHALCIHMITRALRGESAYRTMIAEGHLAGYQHAIQVLCDHRSMVAQYLDAG